MSENDTTPTRPSRPARPVRAPQDRQPRKTTKPVPPPPVDVMESEEWVSATICGETVEVAPIGSWRQSANDAMMDGRFNDWAVRVMGDDDAALWLSLDPTNADVQAFLAEWAEAMGAVAGPADRAALDAFRLRRR